jgi:hypothetical protein
MFSFSPREKVGMRGKAVSISKYNPRMLREYPQTKTAAQITPRGGL